MWNWDAPKQWNKIYGEAKRAFKSCIYIYIYIFLILIILRRHKLTPWARNSRSWIPSIAFTTQYWRSHISSNYPRNIKNADYIATVWLPFFVFYSQYIVIIVLLSPRSYSANTYSVCNYTLASQVSYCKFKYSSSQSNFVRDFWSFSYEKYGI